MGEILEKERLRREYEKGREIEGKRRRKGEKEGRNRRLIRIGEDNTENAKGEERGKRRGEVGKAKGGTGEREEKEV